MTDSNRALYVSLGAAAVATALGLFWHFRSRSQYEFMLRNLRKSLIEYQATALKQVNSISFKSYEIGGNNGNFFNIRKRLLWIIISFKKWL